MVEGDLELVKDEEGVADAVAVTEEVADTDAV